jgi:hypothetical protein
MENVDYSVSDVDFRQRYVNNMLDYIYMASFRQLLTAQQSVNTQGIENNLYKINTLLSSTDNQTTTISSLQALINENSSDIDDLGTLTQSHTTQLDQLTMTYLHYKDVWKPKNLKQYLYNH